MRLLLFFLAAAVTGSARTPYPTDTTPPCLLKVGVGIGCLGDQFTGGANAVDLFYTYGFDKKRLLAPATQLYLQRFDCFRVIDNGKPLGLHQQGYWPHATPDGVVNARFMQVRIGGVERIFWMAEPYLAVRCPRF